MTKKDKKRHGFVIWIIYGAFALSLCVGAAFALKYTHAVVLEYDAAQPEKVTDEFSDVLKNVKNGSAELPEYVNQYLIGNEKYNADEDRSSLAYLRSHLDGELSIRLAGTSSDGAALYRRYTVQSGGVGVGELTLRGVNQRTKLFFFSMADWSVEKFEPVVSAEYYSIKIYMPDNIRASVNGVAVSEDEIKNDEDVPYCHIDELLKEPTVTLTENGKDVDFSLQNGVVYPIRYCCTLTLPDYIKVFKNKEPLECDSAADGQRRYSFAEMREPVVEIEDETGYRKTVSLDDPDVTIYEYSVTVPDAYTLSVGDLKPAPTGKVTAHRDADIMSEFYDRCDMRLPDGVEYVFKTLDPDAEYVIHTGEKDVVMKGRTTVISDFFPSDTQPEFGADIDIFKMCKVYSDLMTCDLEGELYGFHTAAKYLVKGSALYKYAYKWATGMDITYGWTHKINGVYDTSITDYIKYSDTCFSCRVYFRKEMYVYFSSGITRNDVFDNTVYFVYVDDSDNGVDDPHWAIGAMHGLEAENESN